MSLEEEKKCCQDCKNGEPGQNKSCQVKRMLEALKNKTEAL